ncbi:MAG: hypothetical protein ACUVQQ_15020 [Thermogutta sp.]
MSATFACDSCTGGAGVEDAIPDEDEATAPPALPPAAAEASGVEAVGAGTPPSERGSVGVVSWGCASRWTTNRLADESTPKPDPRSQPITAVNPSTAKRMQPHLPATFMTHLQSRQPNLTSDGNALSSESSQ